MNYKEKSKLIKYKDLPEWAKKLASIRAKSIRPPRGVKLILRKKK